MLGKNESISLNFSTINILVFFLVLLIFVGIYHLKNISLFFIFCVASFILISLISLKFSLLFLIFLVFLHGLRYDVYSNLTVRPDQIGIIIILFLFLIHFLTGKIKIYRTPLDLPIILFLFLNLLSSILYSPIREMSLRKCLLLFLYSLFYFIPVNLFLNYYKSEEKSKKIIKLFLVAGISMMLFGLLSLMLFLIFHFNFGGISIDLVSDFIPTFTDVSIYRVFSTTQEPNIFGNISSTFGLIFIGFLFSNTCLSSKEKFFLVFFSILAILSTVFSYTRGAWAALLAGIGLYILFKKFLNIRLTKVVIRSFLGIMILLIMLAMVFQLKEGLLIGYVEKFRQIFEYKTGTGQARVWMSQVVLRDVPSSLILGHGTQAHLNLFERGEKVGIGNFLLDVLHSTGIVGLLVFLWIQLKIVFFAIKGIKSSENIFKKQILRILLISFIGMWIAYQFTQAYWLSFPWLFTSIIVIYSKIVPRKQATASNK